ncbi:MAG TPA: NAD-dependent epimerase/dehydratase family protein [Candidatus Limnocylindrales bacterium]|nr:NAD-dependent epimerase/dehydratase family protein [Candidatus Limnocylindrales bacterium]
MRLVVTGAAGFIGSHLVEAALDAGHDVVGVDAFIPYYPRSVKTENLAQARAHDRFRLVEADLRTATLGPVVEGADAVIHLAAMPGLPRSWSDFELYATCNIVATERLLEAIRATGVPKLVHVSTSSVYGRLAQGDETLPTRPVSPYGVTKLAAEHLVDAFADAFDIRATILRYFSIYGPRQRPDMAYHRFAEALIEDQPLDVFGDGQSSRTSTYVSDAVNATLAAVDRGKPGARYNIGGGEPITVLEAIDCMAEALGVSPQIRFGDPRAGDQRHTAADTSAARHDLGYRPAVKPRDGLRRQVAWHLERRREAGIPAAAVAGR